jgi:hypothetical protein
VNGLAREFLMVFALMAACVVVGWVSRGWLDRRPDPKHRRVRLLFPPEEPEAGDHTVTVPDVHPTPGPDVDPTNPPRDIPPDETAVAFLAMAPRDESEAER